MKLRDLPTDILLEELQRRLDEDRDRVIYWDKHRGVKNAAQKADSLALYGVQAGQMQDYLAYIETELKAVAMEPEQKG